MQLLYLRGEMMELVDENTLEELEDSSHRHSSVVSILATIETIEINYIMTYDLEIPMLAIIFMEYSHLPERDNVELDSIILKCRNSGIHFLLN